MATDSTRGHFCWFNLAAANTQAAIKFYTRIFGWETSEKGGVTLFDSPAGTVGSVGPTPPAEAGHGSWLPYIAVPDIHAAVSRAEDLGASVTVPVTSTGMGGWFAHLKDPQGAAFGMYSPADAPWLPASVGQFSWGELATSDATGAARFYFDLFGWEETGSVDMGDLGTYHMFGLNGVPLGGIYNPGKDSLVPQWVSYVRVKDVAKVAEAAKAIGARVLNGPMQVPGGDWIVQMMDPQGVMIAAHQVATKALKSLQDAALTSMTAPLSGSAPKQAGKAAAKKAPAKKAAAKKAAAKKAAPTRRAAPAKKKAAAGRRKPARKVVRKVAKKAAARRSARKPVRRKK